MRIKTLLGKKVYDSEAIALGKITDAEFDDETFHLTAIEISQGIMKKFKAEIEDIDKLGDSVILKIKQSDL